MLKKKCFQYFFTKIKDPECLDRSSTLWYHLLFQKVLKKVKVVITKEFSQIDFCTKNHMINAYHVRCGWHLVDRVLLHQGPKFQPGDGLYKKKLLHILGWNLIVKQKKNI